MMTATDKLRRLLDERGIKHSDHYLYTSLRDANGVLHLASEQIDKTLILDCLTPEQAVAAISGERTCHRVDVNGYGFRFECSACGYVAIIHNCETRLDELPSYCPNCGAKVVEQ